MKSRASEKVLKFEDLDVWKRAARLSADIYKGMSSLRDFGFRDQLTRAGLSIPSNIAEGFERDSQKEAITFFTYAKAPCGELRTQIYIGMDIDYIDKGTGRRWIRETQEISSMLVGLIKHRRTRIKRN
jgi:four helix bundle protein